MQNKKSETLLEVKNLKKYFKTPGGMLHAVDDVSFRIQRGRTLGVVGESGCGKSTLGRTLLCLNEPTAGEILFQGTDIAKLGKKQMKAVRPKMQMIFQDPYSSLNGRMTVRQLIAEPLIVNKLCKKRQEVDNRVDEIMEIVGLAPRLAAAYPHELDGGRRQRILNLLMDLQEDRNLTYIFITHDLSVVKHISDEIMVMYLGKCVEYAPADEIFEHPQHPYTRALLNAIPIPSIESCHKRRELLQGEVTSPINPKPGCRFAARCPYAKEECRSCTMELRETQPGHYTACPYAEGLEL